jgi:hypothetical protein
MNITKKTNLLNALKPSLDIVWLLAIMAGFGFYVSLVPTPPNDFWWHLKIGEIIFTSGQIPNSNLFAWTLPPDYPFFYGAWLGEWLLYAVYHLGQMELVLFARNALILAAFALAALNARLRSGSWRLAALVTAAACLISLNNLVVRPQIWSWLPFMGFYFLLNRYTEGRLHRAWLLLLIPMMIFWTNVHGAFILGIALMGIYCSGEALRALLRATGAIPWKDIFWLWAVCLLSGLSTVVNPRGTGIFAYVADLLTDQPSQRLIEEWQSPTPAGIANIAFFAVTLLLIIVLAYARFRPTPTDMLLLISFLWLAWNGQRYTIWFGWVSMPILAQTIGSLPIPTPRFTPQRNWINAVLILALFTPMALVQPWFIEQMPLPQTYWEFTLRDKAQGPLLTHKTPIDAVEYLRTHPGGKLFNEMGYGSYLIWALPTQHVFIDPRVELYPYEQWEDYIDIIRGYRYNELLAHYGADRLLLDRDNQKDLIALLHDDPLWQQEYADNIAQIWVRHEYPNHHPAKSDSSSDSDLGDVLLLR